MIAAVSANVYHNIPDIFLQHGQPDEDYVRSEYVLLPDPPPDNGEDIFFPERTSGVLKRFSNIHLERGVPYSLCLRQALRAFPTKRKQVSGLRYDFA